MTQEAGPTDEELEGIGLEEAFEIMMAQNLRLISVCHLLSQELGLMRVYHNMHPPKESIH